MNRARGVHVSNWHMPHAHGTDLSASHFTACTVQVCGTKFLFVERS